MKKWLIIGVSVLVLLVGTFMTVKKVSPVGWGWWGDINTSEGVALKGYDPVEYFWHVSSEAPATTGLKGIRIRIENKDCQNWSMK